jgi:hypothetical protein
MVDAATPLPKPPAQPAAPLGTFPLMEICDDELKAVLGIAHARTIASNAGDATAGTAAYIQAIGDAFEARGAEQDTDEATEAWNDLAKAVYGLVELVRYMGLE